jgi:hypothetical protein
MPKSPRKDVLKMKKVAGGAQQYVRGKTVVDRVTTAGEAVRNTRNPKAQEMLLRAQKDEMSSKARSSLNQRAEKEKLRALASGRVRASIRAQIKGPNVAAKAAHNRIRLK